MNQIQIVLPMIIGATLLSGSSFFSEPWNQKAQEIPGRVECEFYDLGGEGVAYHDSDSINNGSGKLIPPTEITLTNSECEKELTSPSQKHETLTTILLIKQNRS